MIKLRDTGYSPRCPPNLCLRQWRLNNKFKHDTYYELSVREYERIPNSCEQNLLIAQINDHRLSGLSSEAPLPPPDRSRIREAAARGLIGLTQVRAGPMPYVYISHIHIYMRGPRVRFPCHVDRSERHRPLKSAGSSYNAVGLRATPRERKPVNWKRGDRVTSSRTIALPAVSALFLHVPWQPGVSSFLAETPTFPALSPSRCTRISTAMHHREEKSLYSPREPWPSVTTAGGRPSSRSQTCNQSVTMKSSGRRVCELYCENISRVATMARRAT
ncbi:hypothetical protein PUN28_015403 [Cardiocondyla obscurior]|uniref:Uncharacterized protein n=1 Tax=Cardiocondyla obscurior TaxID=286306 RepID=A0AAW2EUL3_9HYME